MKILIVCSGNTKNFYFKLHKVFIYEQIEAVKDIFKIEYDTYFIEGKGLPGYLRNLNKLRNKIKEFLPDVIHAHYGLSGLLSCLQRSVPVVITFHGSDAHIPYVKLLSKIAALLSNFNIFVGKKVKKIINKYRKSAVIPCGIDLSNFYPMEKEISKDKLGFTRDKNYILFASAFNISVKNYNLAIQSISRTNLNIELIELKDKSRTEVNLLLNACDLLLLTSKSEGSPQIVKEAMTCNCPAVATDVGDIRFLLEDVDGCYVTSFNPDEIAKRIKDAVDFRKEKKYTNGRKKIITLELDSVSVAKKILSVYKDTITSN